MLNYFKSKKGKLVLSFMFVMALLPFNCQASNNLSEEGVMPFLYSTSISGEGIVLKWSDEREGEEALYYSTENKKEELGFLSMVLDYVGSKFRSKAEISTVNAGEMKVLLPCVASGTGICYEIIQDANGIKKVVIKNVDSDTKYSFTVKRMFPGGDEFEVGTVETGISSDPAISCSSGGACDGHCPAACNSTEDPDCKLTGCCGNSICDTGETISNCSADCFVKCKEKWICSAWSTCAGDIQTRTCDEVNACGTSEKKPELSKTCDSTCVDDWKCTSWSVCTGGAKIRNCVNVSSCASNVPGPETKVSCTSSCVDVDGDGFDNCAPGMIDDDGNILDCDDGDQYAYPGNLETCDTIDNNCNGMKDEGCDVDGDGFCSSLMRIYRNNSMCVKNIFSEGARGSDCNDVDGNINPLKGEECDGVDNNCDNVIDEGCNCTIGSVQDCGSDIGVCEFGKQQCAIGKWDVCMGGVGPSLEICGNGLDEDCNGIDEVCPACVPVWDCTDWESCNGGVRIRSCADSAGCGVNTNKPAESESCTLTCIDGDGDGYDNCAIGVGGSDSREKDCNDGNPGISPGKIDICGNGIDEDCSGRDQVCSCVGELVDEDQNGIFSVCGCNNCNGCVCDVDDDGVGDGVCVENNCNTAAPVPLNCGIDGCGPSDKNKEVITNKQGWACDSSFGSFLNNYFTQDGVWIFDQASTHECAAVGSYSYVSLCSGMSGEHRNYLPDNCSSFACVDGSLCDNVLNDGNFNPTGTCLAGSCSGVIPDELVDANFDGFCEFKINGCNSDCNGCLCSIDGDLLPDGVCVDEHCIVNAPVVLDCGNDCNSADSSSPAFVDCSGNEGKACSYLSRGSGTGTDLVGEAYFYQSSICGENMISGFPSMCFYPGNYACEKNGKYYDSCGLCSDGDVCSDTNNGNFDPTYGTCLNGMCNQSGCIKDKVDINKNGTFSYCGCASRYNGFVCDTNGDLSGDGLCVDDECVTTGVISMNCYGQCSETYYAPINKGCVDGRACDSNYIETGQTFFEQDGVCAKVNNIDTCVTTGDVCRDDLRVIHSGCNNCSDGDFCSNIVNAGNIIYQDNTCVAGICQPFPASSIPSSFDWRSYNGQNWMTPIKNQGSCGSCWAFASVASIEAKYNIQENNPNLDIDLSEQDMVSDCCSSGSCNGGNISSCPVTDEACYPYQALNSLCSNRCSDWNNRLWSGVGISRDQVSSKLIIMSKGPMTAAMNFSSLVWDNVNKYYTCTSIARNHAVVIVGWDDVGGYWIIKNSWGLGWEDNGYGKIKYGECGLRSNGYVGKVYKL